MDLIHEATELQPKQTKVCVGIGVFDGVHLGHQQLIRQTMADARRRGARAIVVTFDRHPNAVVAPERVPPLIQSNDQKLRFLAALGVDVTWLIRFDAAFSRQTGEEFVHVLAGNLGRLQSVCVGSEFTFGYKRSGDVPLLTKLGHRLGFDVHPLAAVALDGQVVSSTRIRDAIRAGQFDAAAQMLGRAFALSGPVARGDQLGRTLGFPTANLDVSGRVVPPSGVYMAQPQIDGVIRRAVVNIGTRPTLGGPPTLRVEAHLLNFQGDLYGRELELEFIQHLREERKFPSLDALKAQIAADVAEASNRFDAGLTSK